MTPRVLIVTPWFPNHLSDQTGNFVLHSAEALLEAGVAVTVLVCRPWVPRIFGYLHSDWIRPPVQTELFDPILRIELARFINIPRSRCNELFGPLFRMGASSAVHRIVREQAIQLIHVHTESAGYAMAPLARELGLPLVITIHGFNTEPRLLDTAWKRNRLGEALRRAARVLLVGESLVPQFGSLAGSTVNFRVVHNGYRVSDAHGTCKREIGSATMRFISVSNLHEGKGIDLNLRALAGLMREGIENWTYAIVGDGAERPLLEEMVGEFGLREKVSFLGRMTHDQVLERLLDADVFVLPSFREAFGVAYLEAMASGLLAIGVFGQGPEAFIRHRETGILVKPGDVDSLQAAMRSVFGGNSEIQRIAEAGRMRVATEFSWRQHAERLMAVYAEALDA